MENKKYTPRTVENVTIDSYRGQAILHIPVGEGKFDFAFGIKKAQAIDQLMKSGRWRELMRDLQGTQDNLDRVAARKSEVIPL